MFCLFTLSLRYSCIRVQGIHAWQIYWVTLFGWPRKSRSTSGSGGTDDSVLWIFEISPVFMFSRSVNPFLTFLQSYQIWVTSKIQVNFRYRRYTKVLMIVSYEFLEFLQYLCFRSKGIHFWHSYCSSDLKNLGLIPVQEVLMILLSNVWNFSTSFVFQVNESIANLFLLRYLVWATSKSGSMSGSRGFRDHPNKVAQLECQR